MRRQFQVHTHTLAMCQLRQQPLRLHRHSLACATKSKRAHSTSGPVGRGGGGALDAPGPSLYKKRPQPPSSPLTLPSELHSFSRTEGTRLLVSRMTDFLLFQYEFIFTLFLSVILLGNGYVASASAIQGSGVQVGSFQRVCHILQVRIPLL